MTSPTLAEAPTLLRAQRPPIFARVRRGTLLPALLFLVTLFTTTAVGMRYMQNFRAGLLPLATDADILPLGWIAHHLGQLRLGLPFSLTLIAILLAHEFGHYVAARVVHVRATLPYLLPAPSLSGTFGAVIRLESPVRTRTALLAIGASGPLAGFAVALLTTAWGLAHSTAAAAPVSGPAQAPLLLLVLHGLLSVLGPQPALATLIPHPVLVASWIGLLITAINLLPAGQLDGGHIVYAVAPAAHRTVSRITTAALLLLGVFAWAGWFVWGLILLLPALRHPRVPRTPALPRRGTFVALACAALLILCLPPRPFAGYSVLELIHKFATHTL